MPTIPSIPATDTHFHVFDAAAGVPAARYVPAYPALLEDWRVAALANGVARGVLVQPSFLGTDNARLLQELQQQPDMLRGVAVVDAQAPLDDLRALAQAGVRGIRLNLVGASGMAAGHLSAPWEAVMELGWHVELHTEVGGLPPVLAALPEGLPVVVDHMGKPATARSSDPTFRALARRSTRGPVHVKLSGAYRQAARQPAAIARCWLDLVGPAALLWGSDWPCTNHEEEARYDVLLGQLHAWVGAEVAGHVLRDNPDRLYWRDQRVP